MPQITDIPARIAALPPEQRGCCQRLYEISAAAGRLELPPSMHAWTERQFGSLAAVREQHMLKVTNRWTLEGALFNPTRARRPALGHTGDTAIDAWVAAELREDIFAQPLRTTPADPFGRIEGRHCITASNIAKYDGWHGVVICHEPHPLRFDAEQIADYIATAWRWIEAAHRADPSAIYPLITWNCLPKSGASLAHGHLQVALGAGQPYAQVERWRQAAQRYRHEHGRAYADDLHQAHAALGLALPPVAGCRRLAHLTPARNREVVMLAPAQGQPAAALAQALAATLLALRDERGVRAFNAALAFPPLCPDGRDWGGLPAFARVGDRGDALSIRSDLGVMELYGMAVITADPYELLA